MYDEISLDPKDVLAVRDRKAPRPEWIEVRRRAGTPKLTSRAVRGPHDAALALRAIFHGLDVERFVVLGLDGRHCIRAAWVVSEGTASASLVHPRETFRLAIVSGCCGIIVAHNHPSGDATPSSSDDDVTRRVAAAGNLLGIALIDHVIVAESPSGDWVTYSYRENRRELFGAPLADYNAEAAKALAGVES